jgi:hypothetical protein
MAGDFEQLARSYCEFIERDGADGQDRAAFVSELERHLLALYRAALDLRLNDSLNEMHQGCPARSGARSVVASPRGWATRTPTRSYLIRSLKRRRSWVSYPTMSLTSTEMSRAA